MARNFFSEDHQRADSNVFWPGKLKVFGIKKTSSEQKKDLWQVSLNIIEMVAIRRTRRILLKNVIHTATREEETFKILFKKSQKKRNKVITLLSLFHRI
ncbi:unnamed protein product [Porites lobata]|uniref:Uncharacterized protein n=1 Tax=Porites lobata TaxID=104759 RepID=A0ABN8NEF0_9CNID|nr:unnamed protein product [Porites lobata]